MDKLILAITALSTITSVVGKIKDLAHVLFPGHALTNDEINAAEQFAIEEDARIIAERTAMAKKDDLAD